MLLLSPYGYVSRWGVRFWFQNRYFKGKYGYLSLRHSHMCTFFNVWNLAGLLSFWIYIYIYPFFEVAMSKKISPLWREAHFQVKMYKAHQPQTTFGSWDVEKVHAVVARSTFRSQNVKNTRGSDHFWRFGCRKSACRCGAKDISK